jgi:hypothetical protein
MTKPDFDAVDALCRLQLAAQRLGYRIRVQRVSVELRDLIVFAGLAEVLLDEVLLDEVLLDDVLLDEPHGQLEQRKQSGLEERVDGPDPPA